ncbi:lipid phosphate phosphatase [Klebsormidium nitens]|uniref:Lipid phosphate phosphatase n=1 Tax=Klebsormidium nitens TaxID=105231 RepID=A0A1Y1I212_KLENI|nr:lipid phosphate phosphatase [Klebsormidium nitens]|eukprot:GAQ84954.1 lipid phosphate phosphatase [Klebsormidium nitens]
MDEPPAFRGEPAHGASESSSWGQILKKHMYDWLALILLAVGLVFLDTFGRPFHRYVLPEELRQLRYPLLANSVPAWAIPAYTLLLPLVVFGAFFAVKKDKRDFHNAFMGLMACLILTSVATDSVKLAAGRLRPDFSSRCFPNGQESFSVPGEPACTGLASDVIEGRKSFPSGHSSLSFAGLGYLALYLGGKSGTFRGRFQLPTYVPFFLPLIGATVVAVSRVRDYWHHWQDVTVGSLLGFGLACFCYLQLYPPLTSAAAARPFVGQSLSRSDHHMIRPSGDIEIGDSAG